MRGLLFLEDRKTGGQLDDDFASRDGFYGFAFAQVCREVIQLSGFAAGANNFLHMQKVFLTLRVLETECHNILLL